METALLSEGIESPPSIDRSDVIRVLIVDDHHVVREGLRRMLEMESDIQVIGEARGGEEAIAKAVSLSPDVVVMDLKMPGMDGIAATREIRTKMPDVGVLVLTLYAEDFVKQAVEAGVSGYLLKDSDCEQITRAIRQVHEGLCPIAPSLTRELVLEYVELSRTSRASRFPRGCSSPTAGTPGASMRATPTGTCSWACSTTAPWPSGESSTPRSELSKCSCPTPGIDPLPCRHASAT